jgi:prephenate dehydrogenase
MASVAVTMPGRLSASDPAGDGASIVPEPAARADVAARLPDRIAFLGFGLIGGSIAMAIRAAGSGATISAWTPDGRGPAEGLRRGLVDEAALTAGDAVDGAGLVVLAAPPLAVVGLLEELAGSLHSRLDAAATITDVSSTKALVVGRADALGLPFVGGHPMAGRETSGVGAASADLFVDRPWVICPADGTDASHVERVESLAVATGARPIRMRAEEHDVAVASISHLPLVVAAAMAESVAGPSVGGSTWPLARRLAATGWADMTRLARGDPEMGAGILATNAGAVTDQLRALREALDTWIVLLEAEGTPAPPLRGRLGAAREALEREDEG